MKTGSAYAKILGGSLLVAALWAAAQTEPRRILVTLADPLPDPLTAVELDLRVAKKPAEVTRVYQPQERPVQLALLIDDSAGPEVAEQLPALANFIRSLPTGSQVMVAYLLGKSLESVLPFTSDLEKAALLLRAPRGGSGFEVIDIGPLVSEVLKGFPSEPGARAELLYVGYLVPGSDALMDSSLSRAIGQVQDRGVTVWSVHGAPPTVKWFATVTALERLTKESGGRAWARALGPIPVVPALEELRALLDRQYLVEFTPPTDKNGQPLTGKLTLAVRGRKEVKLLHPAR